MDHIISRIEADAAYTAIVKHTDKMAKASLSLDDVKDIDEFITGLVDLLRQARALRQMRKMEACRPRLLCVSA